MSFDGGLASGFCVVGNGFSSTLKIYQHCIEEDLRKLNLGKKLFENVEQFAENKGYNFIHLRCRHNLESNKFWQALNFSLLKTEKRQSKRTKIGINHWIYKLRNSKQHLLI